MQRRTGARTRATVIAGLAALGTLAGCGNSADALFTDKSDTFVLSTSSAGCSTDPGIGCADVALTATVAHKGAPDARPEWRELPAGGRAAAVDHLYRNLQPDGRWALSLGFKPLLPPGVYTGEVELTLGAPLGLTEYRPARLSYRLEVRAEAGEQSAALQPLPGAGPWQGSGGNAARNPALEVHLDASRFSRRWTRLLGFDAPRSATSQRPAFADGTVYLAGLRPRDQGDNVWALSEHDGARRWSATVAGRPAYAVPQGDQLLVAADVTGADARIRAALTSLTAAAGVQRYQREFDGLSMSGQGGSLGAALVLGQAGSDTVAAFDLNDGHSLWSAAAADRGALFLYANWAAAIDARLAYTNIGGSLRAHRLSDGVREFSVTIPARGGAVTSRTQMNQVPVLADAQTLLSLSHLDDEDGKGTANQLSAIDLAAHAVRWTIDGQFTTLPVAAGEVFYVGNQASRQLEARSLASGALLWAWPLPDDRFHSQLVLTRSHLFLATDRQTVALDLATRQPAWRYGLGGWLALSDRGLLYIMSREGSAAEGVLVAINLR